MVTSSYGNIFRVTAPKKGQLRGKGFHFMTSSCYIIIHFNIVLVSLYFLSFWFFWHYKCCHVSYRFVNGRLVLKRNIRIKHFVYPSQIVVTFVWWCHGLALLSTKLFLLGKPPANDGSPHKGPVTRKASPFDDVIMKWRKISSEITGNFKGYDIRITMCVLQMWCVTLYSRGYHRVLIWIRFTTGQLCGRGLWSVGKRAAERPTVSSADSNGHDSFHKSFRENFRQIIHHTRL